MNLNVLWSSCRSALYSCQILMKIELTRQTLEKILKYQISSKSAQWEATCSVWTDERTDLKTLTVDFLNFAKRLNTGKNMEVTFFVLTFYKDPFFQ